MLKKLIDFLKRRKPYGFNYRKRKRLVAHAILGVFVGSVTRVTEFKNLGKTFNQRGYKNFTISELEHKLNVNNSDLIYSAVNLLKENRHLEEKTNPIPDKAFDMVLGLTIKGEDAFKSHFYHVENRKDRLEQLELRTKWIIPIVSTLIALIALVISLSKSCGEEKQPYTYNTQIIHTEQPKPDTLNKKKHLSDTVR